MAERLGGIRGLGYTLLGITVQVYAVTFYVFWILPRAGWLYWSGQIPDPRDPGTWRTHDREGKC